MFRIAILDLYNNAPNEGMRCLKQLLADFHESVYYAVFDVRVRGELPGLDFDAYISTGGPGNPYGEGEEWEAGWAAWINAVLVFNKENNTGLKHVFMICHSFQLMCIHQGIGQVSLRHSPSFGIVPVHLNEAGHAELLMRNLPDPFYTVDSRSYQVLVKEQDLEKGVYTPLAFEKIRLHVPYERAVMAIRFSPEIIGTQFHPEADPIGMGRYFEKEEKKQQIIAEHGQEKYTQMMYSLHDPQRLIRTYSTLLPSFLENCFQASLIH